MKKAEHTDVLMKKKTFKVKQILCSIHDTRGREYVSRYRVANMHMYS